MERPVTLILAATTPALGIGSAGALPWRLKNEMKYFRQVTDGGVVIMGRKTWESIPSSFKPLKNRVNVVVSRGQSFDGSSEVISAASLQDALNKISDTREKVFVIGGAQLYSAALQHPATRSILLTLIDDPERKISCDTFFQFNRNEWKLEDDDKLREFVGQHVDLDSTSVVENNLAYKYTLWSKK